MIRNSKRSRCDCLNSRRLEIEPVCDVGAVAPLLGKSETIPNINFEIGRRLRGRNADQICFADTSCANESAVFSDIPISVYGVGRAAGGLGQHKVVAQKWIYYYDRMRVGSGSCFRPGESGAAFDYDVCRWCCAFSVREKQRLV